MLARRDTKLVAGEASDARQQGCACEVKAHQHMGWSVSVSHRDDGDRQQIDDGAAVEALERKTGARGLRSIMERALLDTMFELPAMSNVEKVVLDESSIEEDKPPMLVYRSREKQA